MILLYILSIILIVLGILLLVLGIICNGTKPFKLKKHNKDRYAILIPARDESKVIENLLKSIEVQNKDMSNVYVIVEEETDPTVDITSQYGANIFVRPKPIRARKGFALDECIKDILKKKHYDLYFIFDADNILDEKFISNMLKTWHQGYDVAIGYRNILNPKNVISSCSGIVFILFNMIMNKLVKCKSNRPAMLTGTGFYISGKLIEKWNGFPFHSLTEDYELSLYLSNNHISSTYNEKAIYYDEQPLKMGVSIKQRTRWIKGFDEARNSNSTGKRKTISTRLGIVPIVSIIMGIILLFVFNLINVIITLLEGNCLSLVQVICLCIPIIVYIVLLFVTVVIVLLDRKVINLPKKVQLKAILFMPIFLFTFVICYFRSIFIKEVKWDKIEHIGNN